MYRRLTVKLSPPSNTIISNEDVAKIYNSSIKDGLYHIENHCNEDILTRENQVGRVLNINFENGKVEIETGDQYIKHYLLDNVNYADISVGYIVSIDDKKKFKLDKILGWIIILHNEAKSYINSKEG